MPNYLINQKDLEPFFILKQPGFLKKSAFWVSSTYNLIHFSKDEEKKQADKEKGIIINSWDRWNRVGKNLYLSKQPYADEKDDLEKFIKLNKETLGLVISAISNFELAGIGLSNLVVFPENWEVDSIKHRHLLMQDFQADVPCTAVIARILEMRASILDEKAVVVHCKAGRARSAMVVLVYFVIYGDEENNLTPWNKDQNSLSEKIQEVKKHLKNQRAQLDLGDDKIATAIAVIREMIRLEDKNLDLMREKVSQPSDPESALLKVITFENLSNQLISLELKNAIINLASFKKLAIYALTIEDEKLSPFSNTKRTTFIRDFFRSIYDAKNGDWYSQLEALEGPLAEMKNAQPNMLFEKNEKIDSNERAKMFEDFKKTLDQALCKLLHCTENALKECLLSEMKKSATLKII